MNMTRVAAAIILGLLIGTAIPARADSASATMQVSVQVIARAIVTVDSQPLAVEVTAQDIERGYVDVQAPIVVRVRTNSRRGYALQVENRSEAFSSIELTNTEVEMRVSNHESFLQRPYVAGGDVMPLHARLRLSPDATPGSVALPIAFSASPL